MSLLLQGIRRAELTIPATGKPQENCSEMLKSRQVWIRSSGTVPSVSSADFITSSLLLERKCKLKWGSKEQQFLSEDLFAWMQSHEKLSPPQVASPSTQRFLMSFLKLFLHQNRGFRGKQIRKKILKTTNIWGFFSSGSTPLKVVNNPEIWQISSRKFHSAPILEHPPLTGARVEY